MAKKRRRKKISAIRPEAPPGGHSGGAPLIPESRSAEIVTVSWMMSVMMTLLCAASAGLISLAVGDNDERATVSLLGHMLHFSSIVTAVVSLGLLAAAYKLRRVPPPTSVAIVAAIVAVLPILAAFF